MIFCSYGFSLKFLINSKIDPEQDIILEFPQIQVIQHFKYGDGILYYHTFETALKLNLSNFGISSISDKIIMSFFFANLSPSSIKFR